MLVNAMSTHAFCLSEDFFTFENIQSEMQECIQDDYRKINFSVDFDTQKLDSIMHQKFGEDEYIFRVSTDEKVAKVENFEITVVGNRYREYDFSKSDLPFKPKENADLFNNLVDIFTPMILLMNYLNSSNTDLPN